MTSLKSVRTLRDPLWQSFFLFVSLSYLPAWCSYWNTCLHTRSSCVLFGTRWLNNRTRSSVLIQIFISSRYFTSQNLNEQFEARHGDTLFCFQYMKLSTFSAIILEWIVCLTVCWYVHMLIGVLNLMDHVPMFLLLVIVYLMDLNKTFFREVEMFVCIKDQNKWNKMRNETDLLFSNWNPLFRYN